MKTTTSSAPVARAHFRILLLSLAAAWPVGASAYRPFDSTDAAVTAKGEMEMFVEYERDLPATVSGLIGTIWRASEGLSFDAGVRLARAGGVNAAELRAGLTWGFRMGFPR